jgi:hypothetical protein
MSADLLLDHDIPDTPVGAVVENLVRWITMQVPLNVETIVTWSRDQPTFWQLDDGIFAAEFAGSMFNPVRGEAQRVVRLMVVQEHRRRMLDRVESISRDILTGWVAGVSAVTDISATVEHMLWMWDKIWLPILRTQLTMLLESGCGG